MGHSAVAQECLTGTLKERVGDLAVLSTERMLEILSVSRATYSRYRDELIEQEIDGFVWYFNAKGCDTIAGEYLFQYAKLVKQLGKARADNRIKQHMEDFWKSQKK